MASIRAVSTCIQGSRRLIHSYRASIKRKMNQMKPKWIALVVLLQILVILSIRLLYTRETDNTTSEKKTATDPSNAKSSNRPADKKIQDGSTTLAPRQPSPRPQSCDGCFNPNINYTLNPTNLCKSKQLICIILVFTEHNHFPRRASIRKTWGSLANKERGGLGMVFLLGENSDENLNNRITQEAFIHGDIVVGSFVESQPNVTLKGVMAIRWAVEHCSHVKYLLKVDDDMWINIPVFLRLLPSYDLENTAGGRCLLNKPKPMRSKKSKYYVSRVEYPENEYPPYCVGAAVVTTTKAARAINRVSPNVPYFVIDDVYTWGLCTRAANVSVVNLPGFYSEKVPVDVCNYHTFIIASHGVFGSDLEKLWNGKCLLGPDALSEHVIRLMRATRKDFRKKI